MEGVQLWLNCTAKILLNFQLYCSFTSLAYEVGPTIDNVHVFPEHSQLRILDRLSAILCCRLHAQRHRK